MQFWSWFNMVLAHGYMVSLYILKPQHIACYHMNKSKYPIDILFFNWNITQIKFCHMVFNGCMDVSYVSKLQDCK
jgi:hypothetical protein